MQQFSPYSCPGFRKGRPGCPPADPGKCRFATKCETGRNGYPERPDFCDGPAGEINYGEKDHVAGSLRKRLAGGGTRCTPPLLAFRGRAFNYGAHFALVEVDTETGQVRVLEYVAAHDLGKALNPAICEAQIQGGVTQGISASLIEGFIMDDKGQVLNLNTTDYKIYTSADNPRITPLIIETLDPLGAYGAKGFAEAPMVAVAGCISNALYSATGIRFKEIPITPEKVLEALWRQAGRTR